MILFEYVRREFTEIAFLFTKRQKESFVIVICMCDYCTFGWVSISCIDVALFSFATRTRGVIALTEEKNCLQTLKFKQTISFKYKSCFRNIFNGSFKLAICESDSLYCGAIISINSRELTSTVCKMGNSAFEISCLHCARNFYLFIYFYFLDIWVRLFVSLVTIRANLQKYF